MDYRDYARATAIRYGLDPDIATRQIGVESNWNPKAQSPAGAQGISQFMPATAKRFGVDPWDPVSAIDGQMQYMRKLLDEFGSYELALAAYNAGEGAVRKHKGIPPYKETQAYVKKILGPDVRMAASSAELPPEMQLPGNPATGQAAMPFEMPPSAPASPFGMPAPPQGPPTFTDNFFSNPWIQLGMGIMASPAGAGGSPLTSIGQGFGKAQEWQIAAQNRQLLEMQNMISLNKLLGNEQVSPVDQLRASVEFNRQQVERERQQMYRDLADREDHSGTIMFADGSVQSVPDMRAIDYSKLPPNTRVLKTGSYSPSADPVLNPKARGADKDTAKAAQKAESALAVMAPLDRLAFGHTDEEGVKHPGIFSGRTQSGIIQGATDWAEGTYNYYSKDDGGRTKVYMDTVEGSIAPMIRAYGDSAGIAVAERESAVKMLPDPRTDNLETARQKWNNLKATLTRWAEMGANPDILEGAGVGTLPPEMGEMPDSSVPVKTSRGTRKRATGLPPGVTVEVQ